MKYKQGDKLVIKIDEMDASNLNKGGDLSFYNEQLLGKLEDFTPAEKKIKMTAEEKAEFDKLKRIHKSLFLAFIDIDDKEYPNVYDRLFGGIDEGHFKAQLEFSRAWDKPNRVEVVKEKYRIKLADGYLVNVMGDWLTLKNKKDGDIFIQSEIDVLQKQEQFKAIDLSKCKEEVEDENE